MVVFTNLLNKPCNWKPCYGYMTIYYVTYSLCCYTMFEPITFALGDILSHLDASKATCIRENWYPPLAIYTCCQAWFPLPIPPAVYLPCYIWAITHLSSNLIHECNTAPSLKPIHLSCEGRFFKRNLYI